MLAYLAYALSLGLPVTSMSDEVVHPAASGTRSVAESRNVVEVAAAAGSFNTLIAAAKAAGLADALATTDDITVFAPTDEAFAALGQDTIASLLRPESKATLASILKFHVVVGRVPASTALKLSGAVTLNGQRLDLKVAGDRLTVDGATVTTPDIGAKNGIIHVIDKVMLPADKNLLETAASNSTFSTLLAAGKAAGLDKYASHEGPFTVFAPTDAAFAKLPAGTVESLLKPENKAKLLAILKNHIVAGRVYSEAALAAGKAKSIDGAALVIDVKDGIATVNGAQITATDLDASNGVIHVIDQVILPSV